MIVSALNQAGDWTFGRGRAGYVKNSAQVRQSVRTRVKCFVSDWFLDVRDGIDWYSLLGKHGTKDQIIREVERRVLTTTGVRSIEKLEVLNEQKRVLTIGLRFTTIYNDTIDEDIRVDV